jgi:hypothetical protein
MKLLKNTNSSECAIREKDFAHMLDVFQNSRRYVARDARSSPAKGIGHSIDCQVTNHLSCGIQRTFLRVHFGGIVRGSIMWLRIGIRMFTIFEIG